MNTSTIIAIVSVIIAGLSLISNLIERFKKDSLELIKYRLDELGEDMKSVLEKLDKYDIEIDERIEKAIKLHVDMYHKR